MRAKLFVLWKLDTAARFTADSNFEAVHIISHGSPGSIQLGSSHLDYDSLSKNAGVLQQWKDYLSADADILLYGCDVAAGTQGKAFVKQLS